MSIERKEQLQKRIFRQILVIIIVVSIGSVIGNFATGFPIEANFKWLVVFMVAFIMLRYLNEDRYGVRMMFAFVTFLVYVILPLGWYNSGRVNNNAIIYAFVFVIGATILFKGWQRLFLIISTGIFFVGFIVIEFTHPEFLPSYGATLIFWDRLIQIPLAIAISAGMLIQFADTFHKNNDELMALTDKYMELAYTDSLTGIGNRGYIIEELEKLIDERRDFVTLMIDLDNFKHVNDTYGHLWGDRLLEQLADVLQKIFGEDCLYGRYGGDEFIVILFADMAEVDRRVGWFTKEMRENKNFSTYGATISGGYSRYPKGMALDQYLKRIDLTLYNAKGTGKDKILKAE